MESDSVAFNPYAPPVAAPSPGQLTETEKIRWDHLKFESGFRGVGGAYILLGAAGALIGALLLSILSQGFEGEVAFWALFFLALTVVLWWLAFGLRNLKEGVRKPAFVFGVIGLLAFPIGTILNGYLLYLLMSAKGKRTLSPDYQQIIAATPHIYYKSPWLLSIVVILLAILIPILILYFGRG